MAGKSPGAGSHLPQKPGRQLQLTQSPGSIPSSPTSPRSPCSPCSPAARNKAMSPFARFRQLENEQAPGSTGASASSPAPVRGTNLFRNSSLPASPRPTVGGPTASPGAVAARSGSGAKEMILMWVQNRIKDYPIPMTNFSTCWNDGLAFCALIHVFYPESFDWNSLKAENRRHNFTLGFEKAEELAGIYPLLEVDDMVRLKKPDWKCVFTYVQSFYRRFRDGRSPPKTGLTIPGPVPLSPTALAVAESQEAEKKGKQIVEQMTESKQKSLTNSTTSSKGTIKHKPPPLTGIPKVTDDFGYSKPMQQVQCVAVKQSMVVDQEILSPTLSTSSKESWQSCDSKISNSGPTNIKQDLPSSPVKEITKVLVGASQPPPTSSEQYKTEGQPAKVIKKTNTEGSTSHESPLQQDDNKSPTSPTEVAKSANDTKSNKSAIKEEEHTKLSEICSKKTTEIAESVEAQVQTLKEDTNAKSIETKRKYSFNHPPPTCPPPQLKKDL